MHRPFFPASLLLAMTAPLGAQASTAADSAADVQALRQELTALRADYEARLNALEQRLRSAEAAAAPAPSAQAAVAPPPAVPAATGAAAFNPAISLVLAGQYGHSSRDPAGQPIAGFASPPDAAAGMSRGFNLGETELGIEAAIDPWWRGAAHFALGSDNAVSVEQAYVQTSALGSGLTLTAGRYFSGIGYLNGQHAHAWDFADSPLAYQAMLGTQLKQDGLRLAWLAPTDLYLELGAELGSGSAFPGNGSAGNGAGAAALTLHAGGDWGASHSWRAGVSLLQAKAADQALATADAAGQVITSNFSGHSQVWIADAVWKWAPEGNATRSYFKLQGEWLQLQRSGSLVDAQGLRNDAWRSTQSGGYLQAVYQFVPRWRLGLRTERLDAGGPDDRLGGASSWQPSKATAMLDFGPSEFSRLRLQFARDRSREGAADRQITLQYQMSLGAHGAHGY